MKTNYKFFAVILALLAVSFSIMAQTTVFVDDFNRTTFSSGGTPLMSYYSYGSAVVMQTNTSLRLNSVASTVGNVYVYGATGTFSQPFNNVLSSNVGTVEWTFNSRYGRTSTPAGLASGEYGYAVVLAGTDAAFHNAGNGYAIVYGNANSPDPIRLVKYTGGLQGTLTDIIVTASANLAVIQNYASVRVKYIPSTNSWSLYVRDDGTSAWVDVLTTPVPDGSQYGTTVVDNTYTATGNNMTNFGFFWSFGSSGSTQNSTFDNFKVTVVNEPPTWTSGWPKTENQTVSGFTAKSNINNPGTTYFVVLASGATAPSSAQVKAGQDASGTALAANEKGTVTNTAGATEYTATVTGLSAITTYDVYFVAENSLANLQASPQKVSVTTLPTTYTWNQTGTASWATAGNWTPTRTTPTQFDILQINGGVTTTITDVPTQTIGQLTVANNTSVELQSVASTTLTVGSGAGTVTVKEGALLNLNPASAATMTVSGNIVVENGGKLTNNTNSTLNAVNLTLQSSSAGTGTFINKGTLALSGTATVQQYLTNQTWYLTTPVWDGVSTTNAVTPTNLSRIQGYNEGVGTGNDWSTSGTTMIPYKGYITTVSDNPKTVVFTGKINGGNISIPLTRQTAGTENKYGFNLIGNPYTAYLDWKLVSAANTSKMPTTTMWYRTNVGGGWGFSTVNGAGEKSPANVSDLIPPMQAFWVRVSTVGNSTLDLTTAMLAHDNASTNKMKAPAAPTTERTKVRLLVSNSTNTDELLIYTDAQASNNFDMYDSPKMSNSNVNIPEISTFTDGESLVINGLNSLTLDAEIPVRFMTLTANSFTLKANEISNLPEGIKVILKDNGNEFDLTNGAEYSFSSDVADNSNRFSLLFRSPGISTDLENKLNEQAQVFVNAANQITIIAAEKSNYVIYNAVGQLIENGVINTKRETRSTKLKAGVYVVKVNNKLTKVIIK